jgi:hypothetical protein
VDEDEDEDNEDPRQERDMYNLAIWKYLVVRQPPRMMVNIPFSERLEVRPLYQSWYELLSIKRGEGTADGELSILTKRSKILDSGSRQGNRVAEQLGLSQAARIALVTNMGIIQLGPYAAGLTDDSQSGRGVA